MVPRRLGPVDPAGVGFLGLGTLTGHSAEEKLAVRGFGAEVLSSYLRGSVSDIIDDIGDLTDDQLHEPGLPSPHQAVGSTIQCSFGHVGEIDCLVSRYRRLQHDG